VNEGFTQAERQKRARQSEHIKPAAKSTV